MTVIPVAYRLTVEGQDAVHRSIAGISTSVSEGADKFGFAFKKIAGDIDSVAGKSAAGFARMADNVLGVVEAFAGGGGLIGVVSASVALIGGKLVEAFNKEQERAAQSKAGLDALSRTYQDMLGSIEKVTIATQKKSVADLDQIALQRESAVVALQVQYQAQNRLRDLTKVGSDEREAIDRQHAQTLVEIKEAQNQALLARQAFYVARNKELSREAREAEAADSQARAEQYVKDLEWARAEEKRQRDEMAAEERARMAEALAMYEQQTREMEGNAMTRAEAERLYNEQVAETTGALQTQINQALHWLGIQDDAAQKTREYTEQIKAQEEALRRKEAAEEGAAAATLMHAQAQTAISAAQMVATPIVGELTGALGELGNVNRDNLDLYRMEMQELPALLAQKAQAIMAQIAVEAAGRAVMETGAAAGALATGLGLAALGQPGAPAAFASAAAHATAASVYATISGGAGTAALGIGLTRGSGGLFQLTKEEADERNKRLGRGDYADRERGGGGGGGGATGRVGGMGRGGGGGPQETVINIIYGAGSVGGDDTRTAQTVVRGMRVANRSAFLRQVEGG